MFENLDYKSMFPKLVMERYSQAEIEDMVLYKVDKEKRCANIIFNRPDKKNSIPVAAYPYIMDLIHKSELNSDVKSIVFKGNGEHFGTGADFETDLGMYIGFGDGKTAETRKRPTQMERMWPDRQLVVWEDAFTRCTKIIICQVKGYCYGQHLTWSALSDIVIAAENTLFTHPAWRYIGPIFSMTYLVELVGLRKAQEMMYTCRPITADEAEKCGLVTKTVPLAKLDQEVDEYVAAIATRPLDGLATGKAWLELTMQARGHEVGSACLRYGHPWKTNLRYLPGEWNFLKRRRDLRGADAMEEVDMRVAPRFRLSMSRRKKP